LYILIPQRGIHDDADSGDCGSSITNAAAAEEEEGEDRNSFRRDELLHCEP
jgi:hypothetical protein